MLQQRQSLCKYHYAIVKYYLVYFFTNILSVTLPWCKFFRRTNTDLKTSQEILNDTIAVLERRREKCERYFSTLYDEVYAVAEELGVVIKIKKNYPITYYGQSVYNIPVIEFVIEDFVTFF